VRKTTTATPTAATAMTTEAAWSARSWLSEV